MRRHLSMQHAVDGLRLRHVIDSYTLTALVQTLDDLAARHRLATSADLPDLLDRWIDQHLDARLETGRLDAAELRYRARLFASVAAGFEIELQRVCDRVWHWRRTGRRRRLPAAWLGVSSCPGV